MYIYKICEDFQISFTIVYPLGPTIANCPDLFTPLNMNQILAILM